MTMSCSSFSQQLKIRSYFYQKIRDIIAGKLTEITRVKLLFAFLPESVRVEPTFSRQSSERSAIVERERERERERKKERNLDW